MPDPLDFTKLPGSPRPTPIQPPGRSGRTILKRAVVLACGILALVILVVAWPGGTPLLHRDKPTPTTRASLESDGQ